MSGTIAHLVGDWSVTGVMRDNLDTLSSALQQISPTASGRLKIDCRQVHTIDTTGQQILNVWIQCVRLRGVEPELIIPAGNLRQTFKSLGLQYSYCSYRTSQPEQGASHLRRRRNRHDHRRDKEDRRAASH
jgi:anti-anti-sigma regulatory factor